MARQTLRPALIPTILGILLSACSTWAQTTSLEEGFHNPPASARVQCWWQCRGSAFSKLEITREFEEFQAQGLGGVTLKDTINMPADEHPAGVRDLDYMSPEWLDMFAHMASESRRLGLVLRQRLGSGWNEGGPWVTERLSSQRMVFARSNTIAGPVDYQGPIPTAVGSPSVAAIHQGEAFVVAMPVGKRGPGIDLTAKVDSQGNLVCRIPEGQWTLVSCFGKSSGSRNMSTSTSGAGLHHDHLRVEAADLHLKHVAEPMLARLRASGNGSLAGFNADSWEIGNPTWTPGFRQAFIERRHYDPVPYLPVLARVPDPGSMWSTKSLADLDRQLAAALSEEELRFLFDYRTTVSDLIVEKFFVYVTQWCRAHNLSFEAEAGGGPSHVLPNDLLQAQGAVDVPMGELWLRGRAFVKIASSAAHAYGKRVTSLEALTEKVSTPLAPPSAMKPRIDEAFLLGGNQLSIVGEYSPQEAGLPGWIHSSRPHHNHCQPYWPLIRPFHDYIGRCCFLLQSGRNVSQVAVYRTFRPRMSGVWIGPADDNLKDFPKQFAFDYVGDELIQQHMSVRDGRIVLPSGAVYEILCIDPTPRPTMPLATLEKIRDLIGAGATVVWIADPPDRCPGLTDYPQCDQRWRAILEQLRQSGNLVVLPKRDLRELVPQMENRARPQAWRTLSDTPLRLVHRHSDEADVFFVVNRAEKPVEAPVIFRIGDRRPELWIPETGAVRWAPAQRTSDGYQVAMRLPAQGSAFVVFRRQRTLASESPCKPAKPFDPIVVAGPWELGFPPGLGAPTKVTLTTLQDWNEMSEPGIRYFSGLATYRTTFTCPESVVSRAEPVQLDLGRVADVCEVRLNGRSLGIGWHAPYLFDATGRVVAGENHLEIRVANTWQNRLVGDASLPRAQRVSRMSPEARYEGYAGKSLLPSGLFGPVRLCCNSTTP